MYLHTAQEFIEPRANAHPILGLHQAFSIMGQFNILHKSQITFLQNCNLHSSGNEKSGKHSFPIKIPFSCQYFLPREKDHSLLFLLLTNFLNSGCKVY